MADHAIDEVIHKLTSELYFHGHPINSREAREDVGLTFVEDAPPAVALAMWDLYELYAGEMLFDELFQPVQEAIAKNPLAVPPPPSPMNPGGPQQMQATVRLDPLKIAVIESGKRADTLEAEFEITLLRDVLGNYANGNPQQLRSGWVAEID